MKKLKDTQKWKLLAESDIGQAASVMGLEAPEKASEIAENLGVSYMVEVVTQLGSDAAADLLRNLPEDFREKVILGLAPDKSEVVREILSYAPGTAGSIMRKEFLSIPVNASVKEAIEYLQSLPSDRKGKVSYIYVVDGERRLEGVVQIRDLIFHPPTKKIKSILTTPVVQAEVGMNQMDVAKLLQRHRYLGLPVVDEAQRLVGVISADNVLQVIEDEAVDDLAKMVGTGAEEIKTRSILKIMKLRFPWLLVNIASGFLCAFIAGVFQNDARSVAALFLFVPLVLALSESTGVQGATIVVRNISLGNVAFKDLGALFTREVVVGILIGLACGAIVGAVASYWQASHLLGVALAVSMLLSITLSGLIGLALPLLFRQFKIDPAMASGPLVLAVCDIQTLLVYFTLSGKILGSH